MTTIEHATFCLPRPGATEPRIESFTLTRYADDGITAVAFPRVTRCIECGEQVVVG